MRNRLVAGLVRRGARSALSRSYRSFERRLEGPAASQAHLLEALTRDLARTEYGRSLGLRESESYDELVRKADGGWEITDHRLEPKDTQILTGEARG